MAVKRKPKKRNNDQPIQSGNNQEPPIISKLAQPVSPIDGHINHPPESMNGRDIKQEKKIMLSSICVKIILPLIPITIGYYIVARVLFGWNVYIAGILAGLTGGLWSLAYTVAYQIYINMDKKLREKRLWFAEQTINSFIISAFKILIIIVIAIIIEYFIITYFHI